MPRTRAVLVASLSTVAVVLAAGATARRLVSRPVSSRPPGPPTAAVEAPPAPADVREAIARVFDGVVLVPADGLEALAGDFNGDGVTDLAVVVEPNPGRLDELHAELANWKLRDALTASSPATSRGETRVQAGERLLAIVHGHGTG